MENPKVTQQYVKRNSMEETEKAQIAGFIDGTGTILIDIEKSGGYAFGFSLRPKIRLSTADDDPMLGKLMEYCDQNAVRYGVSETSSGQLFEVTDKQSIAPFLYPLMDHFVSRYFHARLMLEVVIPAFEQEEHLTEDGFYELVGISEKLREGQPELRGSKYTQQYFDENPILE
jgi:LAGLIDADG endonuclease.